MYLPCRGVGATLFDLNALQETYKQEQNSVIEVSALGDRLLLQSKASILHVCVAPSSTPYAVLEHIKPASLVLQDLSSFFRLISTVPIVCCHSDEQLIARIMGYLLHLSFFIYSG